jgi:CDP-glucose 4,6-dehydratase
VTGLDLRPPPSFSNFALSGVRRRISFVQQDVNNAEAMSRLMREHDCVFHLAALALVHDCEARPLETYRTNTLGTAIVLEAFRTSPQTRYALLVTTDKVYKAKESGQSWSEDDPLFATGAYAVSKACAEQVIADYRSRLDVEGKRFGIGRAGNVLVGGDFHTSSRTNGAGRIFSDCFEALIDGRAPTIFSPSYTRPYTYGLDVLSGYMSIMARLEEHGVHGEAFNFGPQEQGGVPNGVLAELICEKWSGGQTKLQFGNLRSEPFVTQALSWHKAQERLGWRPAYSLEQAVEDTVQWYRAWSELHGKRLAPLAAVNDELIKRHYQAALESDVWWASSSQTPVNGTDVAVPHAACPT